MTKWAKRVATLMHKRNSYIDCVKGCEKQGLAHLGMVAQREADKLEDRLIKLIAPKLEKEVNDRLQITDDDIQRAKDHPIENLIDVKKGKCLCPFHNDRNPSASVKNNKLRCWSQCGKSFDVIEVYRKIHGVSFVEAVKQLR